VDISSQVTFLREKGDEMMQITISISQYLSNISYFGVDAYSMKVLDNATYLDYISVVPGHPEYVNPDVEAGENIEGGDSNTKDTNEESGSGTLIALAVVVAVVILFVLILLFWLMKKRK
jgi:hypothetical protein